jgi:hypothetical protein
VSGEIGAIDQWKIAVGKGEVVDERAYEEIG